MNLNKIIEKSKFYPNVKVTLLMKKEQIWQQIVNSETISQILENA